jgi:hypothetical protein
MHARIALIGHSAAGKSSCLSELGIPLSEADMDAALGTDRCPSLTKGMKWLVEDSKEQPIVVVSNHEALLKDMCSAKGDGAQSDCFNSLCIVYLRQPKDRLATQLATPGTGGRTRDLRSQRYTLDNYKCFDVMYQKLADYTIDCTGKEVPDVALEIKGLLGNRGVTVQGVRSG